MAFLSIGKGPNIGIIKERLNCRQYNRAHQMAVNTQTSFQSLALAPAPDSTELAILRTVLYADVFDYALTAAEIHHYLLGEAASLKSVQAALAQPWLRQHLAYGAGYYCLAERTAILALRRERQAANMALWRTARRWGRCLNALPFVRMVAVTGALAMDNALPGDDVDFLIVTRPGRVWLTRALAVALVRATRRFGACLCPNYVLSRTALSQSPRNIYIAHELAQMAPLSGLEIYWQMRAANPWTQVFLPNAYGPRRGGSQPARTSLARPLQRLGERLLSGRRGDGLEAWEQRRKQRKFAPEAGRPSSAAQLDADHVKGHFNDHGQRVLKLYAERLTRYGLSEPGEA
jgi:hypothetical protein